MSLKAKIAKNTIIQVIGKIISTILGLFSLALITRYLSPAGFGEYTIITTFLTFFAVAADLGLTLVTSQMISHPQANEQKLLNNLFGLRLISAILFIGLAPLIIIFLPYSQSIKIGVAIAAASFVFPALNQIMIGLFQKKLSMDRAAIAEVAGRIILIFGIVMAVNLQAGLNGILIATIASSLVNFLLHYVFAIRFATVRPEFDLTLWRKIVTKTWPLAVTIVFNLIYLRADTLILSFFKPQEAVGLYGAAYRLIDVLTTLPFMFAGLILPILTMAWFGGDKDYFKKILQQSFDFMAALAIPIMVGTQFLARPIMAFVAGKDFVLAGNILYVLIFAVGAIFLGTMFSHAVIALDKQRQTIWFYVLTSLTSLLGYLIFIPRYSYYGAAGVTIYSELSIALFSAYYVFKNTRFLPRLSLVLKSLCAAAVMGAFLYFFPRQYQSTLGGLLIVIFLASLIYFLAMYLLGAIKQDDLGIIWKNKNKNGQIYEPPNSL